MIAPAYSTLLEFFINVYAPRRLLGGSALTRAQYAVVVRHFSRYLRRPAQVSDLDEDRLSEFLAWFADGRQAATVWGARKNLMALATYAHKKGMLLEVPDIPFIRPPNRIPQAYSVAEITKLLAAGRDVPGEISGVPSRFFFCALFLCAYDTGGRATALMALEWTDYAPAVPSLLFRAETQKQRADQLLRISPEAADALETIRQPARTRIFGGLCCRRSLYYRLHSIFQSAGLPDGRRDLLQRIRRTTATLMHNRGADATRQCGHSSDAITRRYYLDSSDSLQAVDVLPRPVLPIPDSQRRLF